SPRCASSRRRTRPRSATRSRRASSAWHASSRAARRSSSSPTRVERASARAARAAAIAPMKDVVVKEKAPLDELMLAMDVVDTLRHKELVLARELTAEDRDAKLLDQLREIYTSQGIEVTDEILQRGVDALREERFAYTPPPPSFSRTLARAYVTRGRWGRPVGFAVVAFQVFVRGPELRKATEVPAELTAAFEMLDANTDDPAALDPARADLASGQAAAAEIETLNARVLTEYELRIVSRPGRESGFWREYEGSAGSRAYYLVVEA